MLVVLVTGLQATGKSTMAAVAASWALRHWVTTGP